MPNDFRRPEPTKNEKMFYELAMHLQDIDQRVWSISSHMLALGLAMNVDPKKMAQMLTGDGKALREYAQKINDAIKKIDAAKPKTDGEHKLGQDGHEYQDE